MRDGRLVSGRIQGIVTLQAKPRETAPSHRYGVRAGLFGMAAHAEPSSVPFRLWGFCEDHRQKADLWGFCGAPVGRRGKLCQPSTLWGAWRSEQALITYGN
jgi:hypothetical protein